MEWVQDTHANHESQKKRGRQAGEPTSGKGDTKKAHADVHIVFQLRLICDLNAVLDLGPKPSVCICAVLPILVPVLEIVFEEVGALDQLAVFPLGHETAASAPALILGEEHRARAIE